MTNLLQKFNNKQIEKLKKDAKNIENFSIGDMVKVEYRITEGENTRIQAYEGVVIAKSKQVNNLSATFTVRKISSGIGVERKFQFHSPLVYKVILIKKGATRRGKLYYLRNLSGKSARIKEKMDFEQTTSVNSAVKKTEETKETQISKSDKK
jgi:large subunit ribosomal protein L19